MPHRLYKILLLLGLSVAILAIPAFWFSYPILDDFFSSAKTDLVESPYPNNQDRERNTLEVDFLDVVWRQTAVQPQLDEVFIDLVYGSLKVGTRGSPSYCLFA